MNAPSDYGESVIFALTDGGMVLCELREWDGKTLPSPPGGKVEPVDRKDCDYQAAALRRELKEELGVEPVAFTYVGDVWWRGPERWLLHVFIVDAWNGELPEVGLDTDRPLAWVHPRDLVDPRSLPGLSDLIRNRATGSLTTRSSQPRSLGG